MLESEMHILFLSVWYPHRYDAMSGLFVRKHALAVAKYARVTVLYLYEDDKIHSVELVDQTTETLREIYVYYPKTCFPLLAYYDAFRYGYDYLVAHYGKPDLTHANVFGRQTMAAYLLYRKYAIPYVVTEHWSGYLSINPRYKGFFRRRATELMARRAKCIMPVSNNLALRMQELGIKGNYCVVRNVVDDFFFTAEHKPNTTKIVRLLHISCFDDSVKNISGILRSCSKFRERGLLFRLTLVGTGPDFDKIVQLSNQLGLSENVVFTGELAPSDVAQVLSENDVFVMFSNYENAPVVISEALAEGLPIVATKVGGIPEMVGHEAGVLVEPHDENMLTDALSEMIIQYDKYNREQIVAIGRQYAFDVVGKQLMAIYKQ